jgi:ornithine cyclodeaminase/alanine dehydrogenase-like protein (mu-crystallin family)
MLGFCFQRGHSTAITCSNHYHNNNNVILSTTKTTSSSQHQQYYLASSMDLAPLVSPLDCGTQSRRITVFGSGMFGTALATCLARNQHTVKILTRNANVCESINTNHINPLVLSTFTLPSNITATTSASEALADCEFIVHVIPVQASPEYLDKIKHLIPPSVPIISASKGIHAQRLQYMSDLVPDILQRAQPTAFLSGPSFAKGA